MKKEEITKLNSQLDILPTFLNLMGVTYNDKWYTGADILDKSYKSMIVFPDLSWYDGNYDVVDGEVTNKKKIADNILEEKNSYAEYLVKKNDLVLKYNYFKEIMNQKMFIIFFFYVMILQKGIVVWVVFLIQ